MKKIGSGALPFSSFLTGICGGTELGGREADVGMGVDDTAGGDDGEEDSKFRTETRQAQCAWSKSYIDSSIASSLGLHNE